MEHYCSKDPRMGNMLWLEQGDIRIGVALDYGIRVRHLSIKGMENLFYEQPADLSDGFGTPDTWKLRGGHRLWLTPETDDSYYPDDAPVSYTLKEDGVLIVQEVEPPLGIQKTLEITFREDGTVCLLHNFYNRNDHPIDGASWGVNTLDGCGSVYIPFPRQEESFAPGRVVSLWGATSLADPRLTYEPDGIWARHLPIGDYFKIGVYNTAGTAVLESKGQRLTISFGVPKLRELPDLGCNFELYMHEKFLEMETLGEVRHILPGESASHWETWNLRPVAADNSHRDGR